MLSEQLTELFNLPTAEQRLEKVKDLLDLPPELLEAYADNQEDLWLVLRKLIITYQYDTEKVKTILNFQTEKSEHTSQFTPPWLGYTLLNYLHTDPPTTARNVTSWCYSLTFANA